MRRLSRPHLGALPVKIYFRARDITFRVLPGTSLTPGAKLVLVWKREQHTKEPTTLTQSLAD